MQEKQWVAKPVAPAASVHHLATELGIETQLAALLVNRGVQTFEEARSFFRPSLADLHDPFLIADMNAAVSRIERAIRDRENILIYGDYDVDGTTAVSLVSSYFKTIYDLIDTYIPDRYSEGYGISFQGIDYAEDNNISLIIALDCGVKAVDKVAYANKKGIDFIICDHHNPGEELPEAVAVLNPKRNDCNYPYKELSGCGVGFKLVQAFHQKNGGDFEELLPLLDLLAISIGADIVPITGENRVLTHFGLVQLNSNPRPGIKALMETANKDVFNITNVVFILGPRINAAGRIKHGKLAVELLTETDVEHVQKLAQKVNEQNTTRKTLDKGITEEALAIVARQSKKVSTVVYREDWHKGVIGIVASRLIENYYKPTIVLTKSNGKLAGSARSVHGFDLYAALEKCSDALEQFGGHMYAAGMTLAEENLERFTVLFEDAVQSTITPEQQTPRITYDLEVKLADLTPKFFRVLRQFEPFGPGNLSPIFLTKNLKDSGWAKGVGAESDHLKFEAFEEEGGTKLSGIAFGFGHLAEGLKAGKAFDVVYHLEENIWNGNSSLQLMVKDLKFSEE